MEVSQGGEKPEIHQKQSKVDLMIVGLRLLAFLSTLSATLVMALNKQTRTIVVATIGNVPVQVTLTAKFQHTPAFVYEIIHFFIKINNNLGSYVKMVKLILIGAGSL